MNPFDAPTLDRIRALCRQHRVRFLYLVGSAATGEFVPSRSDYDFLVEFAPHQRRGFKDVYFLLLHDLEDLLGRRVDLIENGCVSNIFVLRSLEKTKVPLYAAA